MSKKNIFYIYTWQLKRWRWRCSWNSMEGLWDRSWIWALMILIQIHGYKCCLEKERMGLLEFKRFLRSNNEDADRLLPSWVNDEENDCCYWERVVCNSTTGTVTQLSLNNIRQIEFYHRVYSLAPPEKTWFLNVSLFHPFEELVSLDLSENWFADSLEDQGIFFLSPSFRVL